MSRIYNRNIKYEAETRNEERCIELGKYIISTNGTVEERQPQCSGISKSTVHKDVTEKLKRADRKLYEKVKTVLSKNKAERHLRGGYATKMKYSALRESKCGNSAKRKAQQT